MSHLALHLHHGARPARHPGRVAAWALSIIGALVTSVLVLDALVDPGGWFGLGLATTIAVPVVALSFVARRRPDLGVRVLGAIVGVYAAGMLVALVAHDRYRDLMHDRGPAQLAVLIVLLVPLGVLAFSRPGAAGLELLVLTTAPVLLDLVVRSAGRPLLMVLVGPLAACALFLLGAARRRATT